MINLPVDEAYAFDYLSILKLKADLDPTHSGKKDAYEQCFKSLQQQIGDTIHQILHSPEYRQLYDANRLTFDAVDKARHGGAVTAKEVDECNLLRFRCKESLQRKFFNSQLTETKIMRSEQQSIEPVA